MRETFKSLKKKVVGRPGHDEAADTASRNTSSPSPPEFGLFPLHEASTPEAHDNETFPVDIVAIHGLNGNHLSTWTHANKTLWLRDLLPTLLPGCRVYTYGYPSKVFFNSSFAGVQEYSRGLLSAVRDHGLGQVFSSTMRSSILGSFDFLERPVDHLHLPQSRGPCLQAGSSSFYY